MYLYFKHSDNTYSFVAECDKGKEWEHIIRYVNKLNHDYKMPRYIRSWGNDEDGYTYDVGSWSEFFFLYNERINTDD